MKSFITHAKAILGAAVYTGLAFGLILGALMLWLGRFKMDLSIGIDMARTDAWQLLLGAPLVMVGLGLLTMPVSFGLKQLKDWFWQRR